MSAERGVVRSMTGFTVEGGELAGGARFTVTVKGVNHRFLDLQFRLPHGCEALEAELRRIVKERVGRGHVVVGLEVMPAGGTGGGVRVDVEVFRAVVEGLRAAAAEAGVSAQIAAGDLVRVPGVVVTEARAARVSTEELERLVPAVAERATASFQAVRAVEGGELARELRDGMGRLALLVERVRELRAGVREAQFARLRMRMRELLEGAGVSEERLLTEAGLMAERSDVEEECVRLRTHIERFVWLLDEGGAVGKRMDFLLQEFNREANTTLAKSGSAAGVEGIALVGLGLEMKAEIERAREQVQNLE